MPEQAARPNMASDPATTRVHPGEPPALRLRALLEPVPSDLACIAVPSGHDNTRVHASPRRHNVQFLIPCLTWPGVENNRPALRGNTTAQ